MIVVGGGVVVGAIVAFTVVVLLAVVVGCGVLVEVAGGPARVVKLVELLDSVVDGWSTKLAEPVVDAVVGELVVVATVGVCVAAGCVSAAAGADGFENRSLSWLASADSRLGSLRSSDGAGFVR